MIDCNLLDPYENMKKVEEEENDATDLSPVDALRKLRRSSCKRIAEDTDAFCEKYKDKWLVSVAKMQEDSLTVFAAIHMDVLKKDTVNSVCNKYTEQLDIKARIVSVREITEEESKKLFMQSRRGGFINTAVLLWEREYFFYRSPGIFDVEENIVSGGYKKSEAMLKSKKIVCDNTMLPEIERIFKKSDIDKFVGHPVHYKIICKDKKTTEEIIDTIIGSLYKNNRLISRRYAKFCAGIEETRAEEELEVLYEFMLGGTVVIDFDLSESNSVYSFVTEKQNEIIGKFISLYKHKVLTFIRFDNIQDETNSLFCGLAEDIKFVEISEEIIKKKRAVEYLKLLAKDTGLEIEGKVIDEIANNPKGYSVAELKSIYDGWVSNHLRENIYLQYANLQSEKKIKIGSRPNALSELDSLVGLENVKSLVRQSVDYFKAQKIYNEKGINMERPSMHMVYTGNPGTAKTTVARLYAEILKENEILSVGNLYEVGRNNLVGKYVGWTAKLVKKHFEMAKGSVLFIDEAYSLLDERSGMYGDEAINTIVQEMEKMRDDIVVIFAGYPDRMKEFISRNNGLKSRISFHLEFPDYNLSQLMGIMELMLKKRNMKISGGAQEKTMDIFGTALKTVDFGNGRFVRNILEKALMKQSSRLLKMDPDKITKETASYLIADDFDLPVMDKHKQFGFRLNNE